MGLEAIVVDLRHTVHAQALQGTGHQRAEAAATDDGELKGLQPAPGFFTQGADRARPDVGGGGEN